jgi:hypothetical protein
MFHFAVIILPKLYLPPLGFTYLCSAQLFFSGLSFCSFVSHPFPAAFHSFLSFVTIYFQTLICQSLLHFRDRIMGKRNIVDEIAPPSVVAPNQGEELR